MNIICSTDDNFVQHCCVMLVSVLTHNDNVVVWILTEGLSDKNYLILKREVESKNGLFNCINVDSSIISKLPMPKNKSITHISPATYYRLLIPEILPINLLKAIYLDCDIIVKKSLQELWDTDLKDYAIGAVHQMYNEVYDANRLGYPIDYGYFNAGVLLINIEFWRKHNTSMTLINFLTANYDTILMHDQDALNSVLHDKTLELPCKWNMLHFFFLPYSRTIKGYSNGKLINDYADYKQQLKYNRKHPAVIHYVSKPKPWNKGCVHPLSFEYYNYLKKTISFNGVIEPNRIGRLITIKFNNIIVYAKWIFSPIYRIIFSR